MKIALSVVVCLLSVGVPMAVGQQAVDAGPAPCVAGPRANFDVSTVKSSQISNGSSSMRLRPDGMMSSGSLRRLIMNAYGLRDFQLTGGPDWVNTSTWDIAAKIDPPDDRSKLDEAGRKEWDKRRSQRLQSLVMDRFQLKCHMVTKELPVYELVLAKGGSKLKETTAEEGKRGSTNVNGQNRKNEATFTGVTTKGLATTLSGQMGRDVVDKTGLTGSYDFTLTWMSDDLSAAQADTASGPTLFTAVEEQLGLKLVSAKGPVEVLVIDGVEKPGEN